MSHSHYEAWAGGIWGNKLHQTEPEEHLPYVVLSQGEQPFTYTAGLALGDSDGVAGALTIPNQHRGEYVFNAKQQLNDESGRPVGGYVEEPTVVLLRPVRGEHLRIPHEVMGAIDELFNQHQVEIIAEPVDNDPIMAYEVHVLSEDVSLKIGEGESALKFNVPANHLVMGGLCAAMALELNLIGHIP